MLLDVRCSQLVQDLGQGRAAVQRLQNATGERKPGSPGGSWNVPAGLWRRTVASCRSSKSPELTSGLEGRG